VAHKNMPLYSSFQSDLLRHVFTNFSNFYTAATGNKLRKYSIHNILGLLTYYFNSVLLMTSQKRHRLLTTFITVSMLFSILTNIL